MYTIFFRTLLIYVLITLLIRAMGKRQVGELDMSELVTTLLLSQIASLPIEEPEIPLLHAIIPILLIVAIEIIITALKGKVKLLKKIFEGKPSVIIDRGKINQKEMSRMRLTLDELLSEIRQQGFGDPADVYYAILEENGKFSILPRAEKNGLTPADAGIGVKETGCALPIICDGEIKGANLKKSGKDEHWLSAVCQKENCRPDEIFLLTVNEDNQVRLTKKEKNT